MNSASVIPLLDVRHLCCQRDEVRLFNDLTFQLLEGELLQIAGPNGVGKTSLLRVLTGLSEPLDGELLWRGLPCSHTAFAQERVYLGHQNALKSMLNPVENLRWWLRLRGEGASEQRILQCLEKVGLTGYDNVPCHQLSAGQQRRVALARLLVSEAKLWILDEPFNALDVQATKELMAWLYDFAQAGGAVIFTSHLQLPDLVTRVIDLQDYVGFERSLYE